MSVGAFHAECLLIRNSFVTNDSREARFPTKIHYALGSSYAFFALNSPPLPDVFLHILILTLNSEKLVISSKRRHETKTNMVPVRFAF